MEFQLQPFSLVLILFAISLCASIVESFSSCRQVGNHALSLSSLNRPSSFLKYSLFEDDDDDQDEDEDDFIDTDALGDWRTFRRNLAMDENEESSTADESNVSKKTKSVSKENEEILLGQNEELAREYIAGVWAHEVSTVSFCVL
jgi:hypothetical protein